MNKNYLDVITAGSAIKDLVSNVEEKEYVFTHVPVDINVSNRLDTYNIILLYEKDRYENMKQEIEERFATHDFDSFLEPSNNYIQLGIYRDTGKDFYKYKISFDQTIDPVEDTEMVSCIVDPKYIYINDVMNRWFEFDKKLEVHKSDDIYQFIDCISKKRDKKGKVVKKLLKK